jgi:hypothetical protein
MKKPFYTIKQDGESTVINYRTDKYSFWALFVMYIFIAVIFLLPTQLAFILALLSEDQLIWLNEQVLFSYQGDFLILISILIFVIDIIILKFITRLINRYKVKNHEVKITDNGIYIDGKHLDVKSIDYLKITKPLTPKGYAVFVYYNNSGRTIGDRTANMAGSTIATGMVAFIMLIMYSLFYLISYASYNVQALDGKKVTKVFKGLRKKKAKIIYEIFNNELSKKYNFSFN